MGNILYNLSIREDFNCRVGWCKLDRLFCLKTDCGDIMRYDNYLHIANPNFVHTKVGIWANSKDGNNLTRKALKLRWKSSMPREKSLS